MKIYPIVVAVALLMPAHSEAQTWNRFRGAVRSEARAFRQAAPYLGQAFRYGGQAAYGLSRGNWRGAARNTWRTISRGTYPYYNQLRHGSPYPQGGLIRAPQYGPRFQRPW